MNFDLTDSQRLTQEMARSFAEKEVRPRAPAIDREDVFFRDLYGRMGQLGILGMTLPAEYGGAGTDTVAWALTQEEIARASAAVADSALLTKLMSDVILANGTAEQRTTWLPQLARGEKVCVIAQTEPGTGSDVAAVQTSARRTADGYVLNGAKQWITLATVADLAVVVAQTDRARGHAGIGLFLVPYGTPGFRKGSKARVLGLHGLETGELLFEDCHVPLEARLGGDDTQGFRRAMRSLETGRIGIGAQALGIAQAAMDEAIAYARQRTAFGQPLSKIQAIQFMVAEMSASIEAARLLIRKAAFLKDQGRPLNREASEAKLFASEMALRVVNEALQVHGACGYSTEFTIERLYRDVRVYQIFEGTSQIQRLIIGRQLFRDA